MTKRESTDEITAEIDEDTRADIEALVEEGKLPSEIRSILGPEIPMRVLVSARREWKRLNKLAGGSTAPLPQLMSSPVDNAALALQQQIADMQARRRLQDLQQELDDLREQRRLDLEARRLDLRARRLELERDYGDIPEEDEPVEPLDEQEPLGPDDFDFEGNPVGSVLKFLTAIKQRNDAGVRSNGKSSLPASAPPTVQPDPSQPLSDAEIDDQIARSGPVALQVAKSMSDETLSDELKKRIPTVSDENLKRIIARIRAA